MTFSSSKPCCSADDQVAVQALSQLVTLLAVSLSLIREASACIFVYASQTS